MNPDGIAAASVETLVADGHGSIIRHEPLITVGVDVWNKEHQTPCASTARSPNKRPLCRYHRPPLGCRDHPEGGAVSRLAQSLVGMMRVVVLQSLSPKSIIKYCQFVCSVVANARGARVTRTWMRCRWDQIWVWFSLILFMSCLRSTKFLTEGGAV